MNLAGGPDQWGIPSPESADAASVRRSRSLHSLQVANANTRTLAGEDPKKNRKK